MTALPPHRETVRDEWIDYNGHVMDGYYSVIFGHAIDAVMTAIGIDADYRERTGCTLYTLESHVRFLREVKRGVAIEVRSRVVDVDAKRLRLCFELVVDDTVHATQESMTIHVDQRVGRSSPWPEDVRAFCENLVEPPPDYAGRAIGMAARSG
ncbi:MAG: thioesterase [Actinophytocola sp.]|nr:thioesterase [Actinophytocola sp.]